MTCQQAYLQRKAGEEAVANAKALAEALERIKELEEDKERLNKLQRMMKHYGYGWILRNSTTGRGMRLHETSREDAYTTVRQAIDAVKE